VIANPKHYFDGIGEPGLDYEVFEARVSHQTFSGHHGVVALRFAIGKPTGFWVDCEPDSCAIAGTGYISNFFGQRRGFKSTDSPQRVEHGVALKPPLMRIFDVKKGAATAAGVPSRARFDDSPVGGVNNLG
jgi:hypothetical protein